jgi:hypothetical protein
MATQLSFFGSAEPVRTHATPRPPDVAPAPAPPPDPRQCDLFDGPYSVLDALESAFLRRDAGAARAAWTEGLQRFPEWTGGSRWSAWIDDLEWLAGGETPEVLLARASSLQADGGADRFPEMRLRLRAEISNAAIADAAERLIARDGVEARAPDGRAAGLLLLLSGRPGPAAAALARAAASRPLDGRVRGYLAEALWRAGRGREALAAFRDACLLSTDAIDEEVTTCAPVLDLLDRALDLELPAPAVAWIPLLADLEGLVSLLDAPNDLPTETSVVREAVDRLRELRRGQRQGLTEGERIALKRALLRAAPGLRELVRRL